MLKSSIPLLLAALALPLSAQAATDLMDVYTLARTADPQLRAAEFQLRAIREFEDQAFANFLPNISGSYQIEQGPFEQSRGGVITNVDQDATTWSVTLTQPIYNQTFFAQHDVAGAQVEQGEAQYEAAYDQFLIRVAEAYFAVLSAQDNLAFAKAETQAIERQLDQAEQRFEVGLSAITDVHEARARYDSARAREIVAENGLDDAREALRALTGEYLYNLLPVQEPLPMAKPEPAEPDAWVQSALENNPSLLAARNAAEVADEQIDVARAGHYPSLNLNATHFDTEDNSNALFSFSAVGETYSLSLNVPIFSGFAVTSRTQQAGFEYRAALEQAEQEQRRVVRLTRDNYRAVIAGISEVEARRQALISAQSALEATEAGFEVGTRTIVDVLISQQQLFEAQRGYAQARYDYLLSTLRLKQAAGALDPQDLQRVNALLTMQPQESLVEEMVEETDNGL